MNKVSKRAWVVSAVAIAILAALAAFFVRYLVKGEAWVSFQGSPHVYSGVNPNTGTVTDRSGVQLLDATDDRVYADDPILRKATIHLLGDRYGYIEAPVLGHYADKLIGYNWVTGIYHTADAEKSAELTLSAAAQKAALQALDGKKGTIGVYNYKTGEIFCAVTSPTYDPDDVPDIEGDESGAYDGVYVNRFFQGNYVPGSIFKAFTTAVALETVPGIAEQTFSCAGSVIIDGEEINCTGVHGEQTLEQALCNSCNCAFVEITRQIGKENLQRRAEEAGIVESLEFDGIRTAAGHFDLTDASTPSLCWSGIGQYTDLINPCRYMVFMGMLANGGSAAQPYLMQQITSGDSTRYRAKTSMLQSGFSSDTAMQVADMMRNNVVSGYGESMFPALRVCAKSGTAETAQGKETNAMFAGFIQDDAYPFAFIVVVEEGGSGARTAAPIAGQVLQACVDAVQGSVG